MIVFALPSLWLSLSASGPIAEDCTLNGVPLHGRVQVVDSFADFEVESVESFPDLKVEPVSNFPDECGEWKFVDSFPDFTVTFVDSFADFTIETVGAFPGLP